MCLSRILDKIKFCCTTTLGAAYRLNYRKEERMLALNSKTLGIFTWAVTDERVSRRRVLVERNLTSSGNMTRQYSAGNIFVIAGQIALIKKIPSV